MQVGNIKPIVFQAPRRRQDDLSRTIKQHVIAGMIQKLFPGLQSCNVMEDATIAKLPELVKTNEVTLFFDHEIEETHILAAGPGLSLEKDWCQNDFVSQIA